MVARLKCTIFQFYEMTPVEVFYTLKELHKLDEQQVQNMYEVHRWLAKHLWNMQGKSVGKRPLKRATDVEVFPWEEKIKRPVKKQQTTEEIVSTLKSLHSFFSKDKNPKGNGHRKLNRPDRGRRDTPPAVRKTGAGRNAEGRRGPSNQCQ